MLSRPVSEVCYQDHSSKYHKKEFSLCLEFLSDYFIMAEGNTKQEKSLEELEREITCGICHEHYTEPKALPCLHYYCKQCILELAINTSTGKPFSCPECRCEGTLPEGGVDELKTAFFVNRLKTTISTMERAHGKEEMKCELCTLSKGNAEAFCRQCARFICKKCIELHKNLQVFLTHEVASLDDLKHGRANPIPVKEPSTKKCLVHEKSLKIYCYDCDSLICQHCALKNHRDHNFEFTKKAAPEEKTKLLEEIEPLKDLHVELENAVEHVRSAKLEVESQIKATLSIIRTSFKELHNILDKREQELVEEAGAIVQEKVNKLSAQEKSLSLASAEVQSVVDYTERCVRHCTNSEVLIMHAEMRRTIEKKIEEHSKSGRSLDPVEEADMGVEVRCAEALQQLSQTRAIIAKLPIDPAKCRVQLEESAEVGKIFKGTLRTRLGDNKPTYRMCKVSCEVKSLHNGVISACNIDNDGLGRYSIQYTPTVRGCHELTVLIDGLHVAGSPFPVFVSIHPTQLGKPVRIWKGVTKPFGIRANSKGELLVTEFGANIIKFNTNGKKKQLVSQKDLTKLLCIAVDDEDNIYCINENNNKILTCDKNGENVQVHEVKLEKRSGRCALFISRNELLIAEAGHKGTVMVYDKELKYTRRIQYEDMGEAADIADDVHGNLYITDFSNSCVRVFSADGNFLYSIGHDKNELKRPGGVCVSAQYVYVTDFDSHCVSVFTTGGFHVTSFGQSGSKDGEFNTPSYLCIDKDGFIYVCDTFNNRIQCF